MEEGQGQGSLSCLLAGVLCLSLPHDTAAKAGRLWHLQSAEH